MRNGMKVELTTVPRPPANPRMKVTEPEQNGAEELLCV